MLLDHSASYQLVGQVGDRSVHFLKSSLPSTVNFKTLGVFFNSALHLVVGTSFRVSRYSYLQKQQKLLFF